MGKTTDDVRLMIEGYGEDALKRHHGNITHAAQHLGISPATLRRYIAKHDRWRVILENIEAEVHDQVKQTIIGTALDPQSPRRLAAAIFYAKAKLGWSEQREQRNQRQGFTPPPASFTVPPKQAGIIAPAESDLPVNPNGGGPVDGAGALTQGDSGPPLSSSSSSLPSNPSSSSSSLVSSVAVVPVRVWPPLKGGGGK